MLSPRRHHRRHQVFHPPQTRRDFREAWRRCPPPCEPLDPSTEGWCFRFHVDKLRRPSSSPRARRPVSAEYPRRLSGFFLFWSGPSHGLFVLDSCLRAACLFGLCVTVQVLLVSAQGRMAMCVAYLPPAHLLTYLRKLWCVAAASCLLLGRISHFTSNIEETSKDKQPGPGSAMSFLRVLHECGILSDLELLT